MEMLGSFVDGQKERRSFHYSVMTGSPLQEFSGMRVRSIVEQIYPFISDVLHALYLCAELQRAEIALKSCMKFVQK